MYTLKGLNNAAARVKEITDAFVEARKSTISGEHNSYMETSIPFPPSYKHLGVGKN